MLSTKLDNNQPKLNLQIYLTTIQNEPKAKIELKNLKEEIKENTDFFNLNINETILFAENKEIENLLKNMKGILDFQDFLMNKTKNQNLQINKLQEINKNLNEEIKMLKEKSDLNV